MLVGVRRPNRLMRGEFYVLQICGLSCPPKENIEILAQCVEIVDFEI